LREGGAFTYLTHEIDSLSRRHQRLIFQYFRSFTLSQLKPLNVPATSRDLWWADSMAVVKAVK
jgi:guanidinoacetate N-methyltransferase